MTTPPLVPPFGGQPPPQPQQQAQAARDVNTASLCRIGQETVQDIVIRTMEIFQLLRNMQVCLTMCHLAEESCTFWMQSLNNWFFLYLAWGLNTGLVKRCFTNHTFFTVSVISFFYKPTWTKITAKKVVKIVQLLKMSCVLFTSYGVHQLMLPNRAIYLIIFTHNFKYQ